MQIKIFSPVNQYNGIDIYVRDYDNGIFEFLFARGEKIYSRITKVNPRPERKLLATIGYELFDDEEIKNIKARLEREATSAIKLMEAQEKHTRRVAKRYA